MADAGGVKIDATLREAELLPFGEQTLARGRIFGDAKGRFPDGVMVRTSLIVSGPDETGIIHTKNSVYQLEMADR